MIEPSLGQQTYQAQHIVSTKHTLLNHIHTVTHICMHCRETNVRVPWVSLQMNDSSECPQHCSSNALHSTRQCKFLQPKILHACTYNTGLVLYTILHVLYTQHVQHCMYCIHAQYMLLCAIHLVFLANHYFIIFDLQHFYKLLHKPIVNQGIYNLCRCH